MKHLTAPTKKPIRLPPVRPNLGVEAAYQKKLDTLIAQMARDVSRTILAVYRKDPPVMAQDKTPAEAFAAMNSAIRAMTRKWNQTFADFAAGEGRKFAAQSIGSADRSLAAALKKSGFTVKFTMTPAATDIMRATAAAQVGLIKSIPQEYLADVQGAVMRSVQTGRDLGTLTKELQDKYGITKRRASTIARDQNNKATASITRARQDELGITKAVWLHSAGGKTPRPEHVAMSGKTYDISKGAFLEKQWTWPGVQINCRCVSCSIIPGLK